MTLFILISLFIVTIISLFVRMKDMFKDLARMSRLRGK